MLTSPLRATTLFATLLATTANLGAAQSEATASAPLVIERVAVLPMDRDTILRDWTVIVADGRITWAGPARIATIPAGSVRIDARDRVLMPGLVDAHVHLNGAEELRQYRVAGVTTVFNMNGRPSHLRLREDVARGRLLGPRIFTAGPAVRRNGLLGGMEGPRRVEAVAPFVAAVDSAGYDFIKVQSAITLPVLERLVAEGRTRGLVVLGHVIEGIGTTAALAAGQVGFEHAWAHLLGGEGADPNVLAREIARARVPVGTLLSGGSATCPSPTEIDRRTIGALKRAGVVLLAGTDAGLVQGNPAVWLRCELRMLVASGLTPFEALAAATRDPAGLALAHFGERERFGVVAVGARADLVLLEGDPRLDLGALDRVVGVVLAGRWLPAPVR